MVRGIRWALGVAAVVLPILKATSVVQISWLAAFMPLILITIITVVIFGILAWGIWYMSR